MLKNDETSKIPADIEKKGITYIKVHMKNRVQSTFLYQCFSLNIKGRVANFYMINMALLCFFPVILAHIG